MNITRSTFTRFRRPVLRAAAIGALALLLGAGYSTLKAAPQHPAVVPITSTTAAAPVPGVTSYSSVVDRVAPAVATVRVEKHGFGLERGLGSGVVFREDGYILTNHHVIDGADKVSVDLADGRSLAATVVGSDAASDLAVIHINATSLPTVPFGNSDRVRIGDVVLAFGNPLGVGQTVTMGIVSAKGRTTDVGGDGYEDFLQTDAPINQGNSGGALVNTNGELVGVNAQILSPSGGNIGLGFAIPSNMVQSVTDQLLKDGVVHRSKLGVIVQPLTGDLAEGLGATNVKGALVSDVEPDSPAAHAGLKQGDVITAIDGQPISDVNALRNEIASTRPDSSVSLTLWRGGKMETVKATLVERDQPADRHAPMPVEGEQNPGGAGMTVTPLTPDLAARVGAPRSEQGLLVTGVDPSGTASAIGIQPGDVLKSVNGRTVKSVEDWRAAVKARADKPALVLLDRDGTDLFVALPQSR